MNLQKFYKNFDLEPDINIEKEKFVQRINQSIFYSLKTNSYPDSYNNIFIDVCYKLGINGREIIDIDNDGNFGSELWIRNLNSITKNDFMETLKVLVLLHDSVSLQNKSKVSTAIELSLCQAVEDLGVRWKDGMFYPSGAKELDEKLINDNLEWLELYPSVKSLFSTALGHFNSSLINNSARKDAITNAYTAIESLTQTLLSNKKNFEKNSDDLVKKLKLPNEYKNIIYYYKQIAHGYSSRHAGSDLEHNESEAFIYLTGILIRLIINKS